MDAKMQACMLSTLTLLFVRSDTTYFISQGDLVLAGERTVSSVNISDWLDRRLRNSDAVPFSEINKHDPLRLSEYNICPERVNVGVSHNKYEKKTA